MSGLIHSHSGLRWIILISLIYAVINSFSGKKSGREFTEKDRKIGLIPFIATHIQLILGFVLYAMSPKVQFSNMMANSMLRFFTMEHVLGMVIAITLITLGYIKSKKAEDSPTKFGHIFKFYLIGLILIIISIPWPFRGELGGMWF